MEEKDLQICKQLASGLSILIIAETMNISSRAVEYRLIVVKNKYKAINTMELIHILTKKKII